MAAPGQAAAPKPVSSAGSADTNGINGHGRGTNGHANGDGEKIITINGNHVLTLQQKHVVLEHTAQEAYEEGSGVCGLSLGTADPSKSIKVNCLVTPTIPNCLTRQKTMSLPKSGDHPPAALPPIDIKPLLKRLWPVPLNGPQVTADEIAEAISHFFTARVSQAQAASLLISLHFTNLDRRADVMAKSAYVMRQAAAAVDLPSLDRVVKAKGLAEGGYGGGLCDIVGTGGDAYNTFNISTTASILASALLAVSKHGNKASTSKSGSADLVAHMQPRAPVITDVSPATLEKVYAATNYAFLFAPVFHPGMRFHGNKASTSKSGSADLVAHMQPRAPVITDVSPATLEKVYAATNYAFLFAPVFHPGMRFVAPIRKELPWRTIFNLLGPLANPVEDALEARVIGVARKELGPVFAEALTIAGSRKAMIICGDEELDEVSCAGPTLIWRLREGPDGVVRTDHFTVEPADFGLPTHQLDEVSPGKEPAENAEILRRILSGEVADDDPIMEFVLLNTAALFVVSGICEADSSSMGPGDDGNVITERGPGGERWKEGVRRARWAVKSGAAWKQWSAFVDVTNGFA
ncbi:hypothetical protein BN1723_007849 [Verticillium longisporum]|uniref:Glycosyl transferase family 3 domain-containing protein n=1 Tax=Verticillium longisporum TaxID=100787 RepID=A0A0G4NNQ5_VERLO|nr:hypothetical protein BN1723_007849 [Verticillium longisporum]